MNLLKSLVAGLYMLTVLGRLPELIPALVPLQLGKVSIALGLLLVLATNANRLWTIFSELPLGPSLLCLLALSTLSVPVSVWQGGSMDALIGYTKTLGGFVVLISLMEGRGQLARVLIALSAGGLAMLLLLNPTVGRMQASGSYDANDIALLFVVFLPMLVTEGLVGKGLTKLLCGGAAFASLGGLALTQSRGGLVALGAVGLHAIMLAKRQRLLILVLCGLGAAILFYTADASFWERFSTVADESDYNLDSKFGRLEIWKGGLAVLLERPIGVGIGMFGTALGMLGSGVYLTAHNSYVQILVELSVPGFAAYCLLLWRAQRMAFACATDSDRATRVRGLGLVLGVTGFAGGSFFLSQAYGTILYTLLAMIALAWLDCQRKRILTPDPVEQPEEVIEIPVSLSARAEAVRHARQKCLRLGDSLNEHRRKT